MLKYLLIAEDHPICATAIKLAAETVDSTIFVEHTETLAETERKLATRDYAALVLDLGLKDSKGLITLRVIRVSHPDLPVLVVSAMDGTDVVAQARDMGARGFLSKSASLQQIGIAIVAVMQGGTHFEPNEVEGDTAPEEIANLSKAQLRVMRELASGQPNKIIAYNLGLAEPTVKSHLSAIYRALSVNNRSEAILKLQKLNHSAILS